MLRNIYIQAQNSFACLKLMRHWKKISAFALTEGRKGVAIVIIDNNIRVQYLGFLTNS